MAKKIQSAYRGFRGRQNFHKKVAAYRAQKQFEQQMRLCSKVVNGIQDRRKPQGDSLPKRALLQAQAPQAQQGNMAREEPSRPIQAGWETGQNAGRQRVNTPLRPFKVTTVYYSRVLGLFRKSYAFGFDPLQYYRSFSLGVNRKSWVGIWLGMVVFALQSFQKNHSKKLIPLHVPWLVFGCFLVSPSFESDTWVCNPSSNIFLVGEERSNEHRNLWRRWTLWSLRPLEAVGERTKVWSTNPLVGRYVSTS